MRLHDREQNERRQDLRARLLLLDNSVDYWFEARFATRLGHALCNSPRLSRPPRNLRCSALVPHPHP